MNKDDLTRKSNPEEDRFELDPEPGFTRALAQVDFSRGSPVRERVRARVFCKVRNGLDRPQTGGYWMKLSRSSFSWIGGILLVVMAIFAMGWGIENLVPQKGANLLSNGSATATAVPPTQQNPTPKKMGGSASYAYMSREERIAKAQAIFVGKVTAISESYWNQDSGEEWRKAPDDPNQNSPASLMIHTITIEIEQSIVEVIKLDKEINVTVIGKSPNDGPTDDQLKVGDKAVFFVAERNLAWRQGGMKKKLMMVNSPGDSFFIYQSDGFYHTQFNDRPPVSASLEDLINEIAKLREVRLQP
jgi:hypothetical protein